MNAESTTEDDRRGTRRNRHFHVRARWMRVPLGFAVLFVVLTVVLENYGVNAGDSNGVQRVVDHTSAPSIFPTGTPDASEPSGEAPPTSSALPGYVQTYENDFTGTSLPPGWTTFAGTDSIDHDTSEQFAPSHVVVSDGVLSLNTWMDPAYNDEWVTGGLCRCQDSKIYGAYFVRSRQTGPGPTGVDLLWPTSNTWPPEIDFNETVGLTNATTATVIWGDAGGERQQSQVSLNIDMTQWHTWGVIWTPTSIIYTVDGTVWGQFDVAAEIPKVPMTLHLQSQTWCTFNYACPTSPQSTLVDWVAEYSAVPTFEQSVGTFASANWAINARLEEQIARLAAVIDAQGDPSVVLTGYSDSKTAANKATIVSENRARNVGSYLRRDLQQLNDSSVVITVTSARAVNPSTYVSSPAWRARSATVEATLHVAPVG